MYWVYMERRMQLKDKRDEAELMTFNLNYQRWYDIYFPKSVSALTEGMQSEEGGISADEEIEIPITDIDELDAFYNSREETRWMGSAEIPSDPMLEGMGIGRRV